MRREEGKEGVYVAESGQSGQDGKGFLAECIIRKLDLREELFNGKHN
jgi:hypothetical protein